MQKIGFYITDFPWSQKTNSDKETLFLYSKFRQFYSCLELIADFCIWLALMVVFFILESKIIYLSGSYFRLVDVDID